MITIEKDKYGEWDFRINSSIRDLSLEDMNALRQMIVITIGAAEEMWSDARLREQEVACTSERENEV